MSATTSSESAAPVPAERRGGRRSLGVMLLLTALGAVLVLTAVGRTWAEGTLPAKMAVSVTGSAVSGLPTGLTLAVMAAAVAVFAVRGTGRIVVGALAALAGAGVAVTSALGASDTSALDAEAARKLALVSAQAELPSHTAWPWVAVAGGVLLALAGLITVRSGRDWPAMGARYEAPAGQAPGAGKRPKPAGTPAELWQALDRGEDPTG
ncbi:TIGR02234 family membrane protein [Kitasatospora sp. NPDC001175]|uniref:TIGR02234 family membrane protein n=1 Tax=Kitasatospora sp. NPDC001175 TaxID=3157103 RepID=UPI003CFD6B61